MTPLLHVVRMDCKMSFRLNIYAIKVPSPVVRRNEKFFWSIEGYNYGLNIVQCSLQRATRVHLRLFWRTIFVCMAKSMFFSRMARRKFLIQMRKKFFDFGHLYNMFGNESSNCEWYKGDNCWLHILHITTLAVLYMYFT